MCIRDRPRPLVIDTGVIPHANGSARARLGDTEIVSGVKIQPDRPFLIWVIREFLSVLQKYFH